MCQLAALWGLDPEFWVITDWFPIWFVAPTKPLPTPESPVVEPVGLMVEVAPVGPILFDVTWWLPLGLIVLYF